MGPPKYDSWGHDQYGNYNQDYDLYRVITFTTKVISDPPGARIELDENYVGDAPLEIQWRGRAKGRVFTEKHTVRALPIYPGQYTQTKFFSEAPGGLFDPYRPYSYHIPEVIFFDMNLAPVPTRYEFDIDDE